MFWGRMQEPGVGRIALRTCADKLGPYAQCADKHLTAKQRELVSAPKFYKDQVMQ